MKDLTPMLRSWITTLSGIVTMLALLLPEIQSILDDDPTTNPNMQMIMAAFGVGGLGVAARDGNKSSKSVGAK